MRLSPCQGWWTGRIEAKLVRMIDEREIWACAHNLMRRHGADAWFHASLRADQLLEQGQLEGHRTFLRILDRIRQLDTLAPEGAVH